MNKKIKYLFLKLKTSWRKKIMGKYAVGVIYNTKNGKIAAPIDDEMVGKKLRLSGEYDLNEIEIIKKYINATDAIYIIGTHWGTLLLPLSKYCKQIVGYEANPITFSFLETNILLNKIDNVQVFNKAIGDMNRKVAFYKSTINSGGSKIKPITDKYMYRYDDPETIDVKMISLDEHIIAHNLPKANGIIMDIEGAEYYALKGMHDTLTRSNFLYIEYIPHHLENVSNTSNKEFFDLILPHFSTVIAMNNKSVAFSIGESKEEFFLFVDHLKKNKKSDDLLFLK